MGSKKMPVKPKNRAMGRRIADLRKAKGYTQFELAVRIKASVQTISNWETGRQRPETHLVTLAKELGSTPDYIVNGPLQDDGSGATWSVEEVDGLTPEQIEHIEKFPGTTQAEKGQLAKVIGALLDAIRKRE